jgi:hypothetical protein
MKLIIFGLLIIFSCFISIYSRNHFKLQTKRCNKFRGFIPEDEKTLIVNTHNDYRQQISTGKFAFNPKLPIANNMIQMYWNEELAAKAQEWADNCKLVNSNFKSRATPKFAVGENIYFFETSNNPTVRSWKMVIDAWFKQGSFFNKGVKNYQHGGINTEAFTQAAWAKSYWIGCGYSKFKSQKGFTHLYVCHYGPIGNNPGHSIYQASDKAICKCKNGLSCGNKKYPNLCCPAGFCDSDSLEYEGEPIAGTIPK